MNNKRLHTPEGVRDIYSADCIKREQIIESLKNTIRSYGYDAIKTPSFEFLDIYKGGITSTQSKKFYRFFDREGNEIVLRPDFTPSIARAYAKYFDENNKSTRLYYEGNVFLNNSSYQLRLKENSQFGAELIGDNSIDADCEILSLVVNCLLNCGLKDFQISLGHADIFKGLIDASNLSDDDSEEIASLIINKNIFGVEEFLADRNIDDDVCKLFRLCTNMYNSPDEWSDLLEFTSGYEKVNNALNYLKELFDILNLYDVCKYISFEPGYISDFDYYTGITFSGYTYGSGEPIVNGGRYDNLLSNFGKDKPAIGFAINYDQLQLALERNNLVEVNSEQKDVILYVPTVRRTAIEMAKELRSKNKKVELVVCTPSEIKDKKECYTHSNVIVLDGK